MSEFTQPITKRCMAIVGYARCEGKPEIGECLCPIHCAQRDADKREYQIAIVDVSEFSDEFYQMVKA